MPAHITSEWQVANNAARIAANQHLATQQLLEGIRVLGIKVRSLITRAQRCQQVNQAHNQRAPRETRARLSRVVFGLIIFLVVLSGAFGLDLTQWRNILSTAMPFLDAEWKQWCASFIVEVTLIAALLGVKWGFDDEQRADDLRRATTEAEHRRAVRRLRIPSMARIAIIIVFACATYTNTALDVIKAAKADEYRELAKQIQQEEAQGATMNSTPEVSNAPVKLEWVRLGFPTLITMLHVCLLFLPIRFTEVQDTLGGFLLARREVAAFAKLDKAASRLSGTLAKLERTSPQDADHAWRQLPTDTQSVVRQLRGPGLQEGASNASSEAAAAHDAQPGDVGTHGNLEELDGLV